MSSAQSSLLWFVARGSGMVAYLLLTFAVALGIAVNRRWQRPSWPRLVVEATHRHLVLLFFLFLIVHMATIVLDPFSHVTLLATVVPFSSSYRPFWVGLGVIAMELGLAIVATVLIRHRIGHRAWHALHLLTYLLFPLSLLHGLGSGSDTGTGWAMGMYVASAIVVIAAILWRLSAARVVAQLGT